MRKNCSNRKFARLVPAPLMAAVAVSACTGQVPGSFRLSQQLQTFSAQEQINTKVDLLWVVDNSSSMDVSQQKLRNGFTAFANKYLQPTWDIRVAVVTTDTYLAHSAFGTYLNSTVPGTPNWQSPYINSRLATFVNPSWNPSLVNTSTGAFSAAGVKFNEMVHAWGPSYSLLVPGMHDGPIPALCFEGLPYFLNGETRCSIRDNQLAYNGSSHCLNPDTGLGESSITQCVNTVQNDTIHSGRAIISTMPSSPLSGSALTAWTQGLANDFMINVSTGSSGHGSERGLQSLLQMVQDNEASATSFFRPNSLRGIIFVSDEDDQTMEIDDPLPAGFAPFSHYQCDQAGLVAANPTANITGVNGFCCSTAGNNCSFGAEGTSCAPKTVDGYTYTPSVCANPTFLKPVASVKAQLDAFFLGLDGASATHPNYFLVSIVALTGSSIQTLQAARNADDNLVGALHSVAVDRGDRYIALGELVGNGSMAMDIGESDYTPILDAIGEAVLVKKATFTLARAPTGSEEMLVTILHADGSATNIPSNQYSISGKTIVLDTTVVLTFAATDQISFNYQPKTVY